MQLTKEQQDAVRLACETADDLKIYALAGTGKTTTLRAISTALPRVRFLYLAFNKGVQLEASRTFPKNVTAVTAHALAYREMRMNQWSSKLLPMRARTVQQMLGIEAFDTDFSSVRAFLCVRDTVRIYCISADQMLELGHVPSKPFERVSKKSLVTRYRKAVLKLAREYWQEMTNRA
jgi:F-box protein 18 (helicase)